MNRKVRMGTLARRILATLLAIGLLYGAAMDDAEA